MERKTTHFNTLLECLERRVLTTTQNNECTIFQKKDLKVGDVVLLTKERINNSHWPIAVVHAVLQGRDNRVRSVWLKLPLSSDKISDTGTALTQHKLIKRGIETISLLEDSLEEAHNISTKTNFVKITKLKTEKQDED